MNEGTLLMQSIVVAIHQIGLIKTEDLEAVGQHFLITDLRGLVEDLVKFDIIGELREVNLLVHQQPLIEKLAFYLQFGSALFSSEVGATNLVGEHLKDVLMRGLKAFDLHDACCLIYLGPGPQVFHDLVLLVGLLGCEQGHIGLSLKWATAHDMHKKLSTEEAGVPLAFSVGDLNKHPLEI